MYMLCNRRTDDTGRYKDLEGRIWQVEKLKIGGFGWSLEYCL